MAKPKVYVSRAVKPQVLARLGEVCETRAWGKPGRCSVEVLAQEVAAVEAVLGSDPWPRALIEKAPHLRIIGLTSVGFDSVDVAAATERGIIVTNSAGSLTDTVADLTLALMLAAARRVCEQDRWVRAGGWKAASTAPMAWDVHHRTLGILGLGRIGAAVADRARSFHMPVIYYDTIRRPDLEQQYGYRFVDFDTLLRECDFLTVHTALTPETKGLLGREAFAKMKPTAYLINTSRGPVVDEPALIQALQEKRLAGAGLDVFSKEPVEPTNPLLQMENVVVLPHAGSATEATRQAMVDLAAENILAVLQGKPPLTPVNPEVLARRK